MSFSTVLALFVGIPVAMAAIIAVLTFLPSWMGKRTSGDAPTGRVVTSAPAVPDPTVMPHQLTSADWTTTAGGGNATWVSDGTEYVLSAADQRQLLEWVERARAIGGQQFCVAFGSLTDGRRTALVQHGLLPTPQSAITVFVDSAAGCVEIVTGRVARIHVDDRTADLAALALRSGAEVGDLLRGVNDCVTLLAEHARAPRVMFVNEPS